MNVRLSVRAYWLRRPAGAFTEPRSRRLPSVEAAGATAQERTNLRFHLSMIAAARLLKSKVHNPAQLETVVAAGTPIAEANFDACLAVLRDSFSARVATTGDGADKVAKGTEFVDFLLDRALATADGTG